MPITEHWRSLPLHTCLNCYSSLSKAPLFKHEIGLWWLNIGSKISMSWGPWNLWMRVFLVDDTCQSVSDQSRLINIWGCKKSASNQCARQRWHHRWEETDLIIHLMHGMNPWRGSHSPTSPKQRDWWQKRWNGQIWTKPKKEKVDRLDKSRDI